MASRFWVGGTGNWDASTTTNWAATSGGSGGQSVPTSSDDVVFDTLSNATAYTVTITATATCLSLTIGNPASGVITFAGSSNLNVSGNFSIAGTAVSSYAGTITMNATSGTKTITTNSNPLTNSFTFNGVGGTFQLADAMDLSGLQITVTNGTFDTNGKTLTCGNFISNNTNTRGLTFGASTINVTSVFTVTGSGLTLTPGTSNIVYTGANTFTGGGYTYYDVTHTVSSSVNFDGKTFDANTYHNFSISFSGSGTPVISLPASGTSTVSNLFTVTGLSAANHALIRSSLRGTATTISAASVSLTNVNFMNVTGAGAATWSGTSIGDCDGNSNITFATPVTRYWVGNGGSWNTTTHWSTSDGGSSGASVPLPQDTVLFTANSITAGSQTITAHASGLCKLLDFSNVLNSPIFASNTFAILGNFILKSGMTTSGSSSIYMMSNTSQTITNNGVTIAFPLRNSSVSCTLADALTSTSTFTLFEGTFSTGNFAASSTTLVYSGSVTRTLTLGSSTWTLTGTGTVLSASTTTGLTFNSNTSTIKITDSSNTTVTFAGGGLTYNNVWFSRGASTASNTISGSNTFTNLKDDGSISHSILFTTGTTQTFTGSPAWTISGIAGQLITINSTTTGTHALVKSGAGVVSADYLNIQHSVATPSSTWYAGANSTNNQATTTAGSGWIFTIPPTANTSGFLSFM